MHGEVDGYTRIPVFLKFGTKQSCCYRSRIISRSSCKHQLTTDVCCALLDFELPERPFAAVINKPFCTHDSHTIFSMLWAIIFDI